MLSSDKFLFCPLPRCAERKIHLSWPSCSSFRPLGPNRLHHLPGHCQSQESTWLEPNIPKNDERVGEEGRKEREDLLSGILFRRRLTPFPTEIKGFIHQTVLIFLLINGRRKMCTLWIVERLRVLNEHEWNNNSNNNNDNIRTETLLSLSALAVFLHAPLALQPHSSVQLRLSLAQTQLLHPPVRQLQWLRLPDMRFTCKIAADTRQDKMMRPKTDYFYFFFSISIYFFL